MLPTSRSGRQTSSKNLSDNPFSFTNAGSQWCEVSARFPITGVSSPVMVTSRSVWLLSAVRVVPVVCRPPLTRESSCARCATRVCIGCTAVCSASSSSGAVERSPRVASIRADTVVGPGSVATIESISSIIRFSCAPALSNSVRRFSVAAFSAARMPTVLSSRPRPVAARMSRSLLIVVWNSTVGNSVSSGIWVPSLIGGPELAPFGGPPRSTSCTDDTANTLLGTTRAVTVAGIARA